LGIRTGGAAWNAIHLQIAQGALTELAQEGYSAFSIEGVAAVAGVNKRTIYRHYSSRLELALAGIAQMQTFQGWGSNTGTPKQRLRAAVERGAKNADLLPAIMATCAMYEDQEPELMAQLRERVLSARQDAISAFLAQGVQEGWARADIHAWQVLALIDGLNASVTAGLGPLGNPRKRVSAYTDAVWRYLARDPDAE